MRKAWLMLPVMVLAAEAGLAQSFEGTHLGPFTVPYNRLPYHYAGSRFLEATITTSADVISALVPAPLDHMMGTELRVLIIEQHLVRPMELDYHEVVLIVPVAFQGVTGDYHALEFLDDSGAIVFGREIWGVSKVDGDIEISWSPGGDTVAATVSRSGTPLITVNASFGPIESNRRPETLVYGYDLKLIPSVEAGDDPDVCQLTRTPLPHTWSVYRTGTGTLSFGYLPSDPLSAIPVYGGVFMETYFLEGEFPFGEVVWDYLAQPGGCAPVLESPLLSGSSVDPHVTSK